MTLPLEGIRILAPTQLGSGPYGTTLLGDLGAEIIKIENPSTRGDEARRVPPYAKDDDSLYYQSINRNTKSLTLNLQSEEGQRIFRKLVSVSDAVFNNLRGDQSDKLGLTYAALKDINPRIVCCSLSGFGRTGPRSMEPGYDFLFQAYSGFMSVTGEPDGPPTRCGISIIDFAGGLLSMGAIAIGLLRAKQTGEGSDIDLSLMDTAVSTLSYFAAWALNSDYKPGRTRDSGHATLVPSQNFPSKDGWIVVMCMNKEKFWQRLCDILGRPDLKENPQFRTIPDRYKNREELIPILKELFKEKTTEEWLTLLRGNVPCAPVNSVGEALVDPQILARDMVIEVMHPKLGKLREVGSPIKFIGLDPVYKPAAPLGGNNEEILRNLLNLSGSEIEDLRRIGAI